METRAAYDRRMRALQDLLGEQLRTHTPRDVVRALAAALGEEGGDTVLQAALDARPLNQALACMAELYGHTHVLATMLRLVERYAMRGAELVAAERAGAVSDGDCPRCRARDAGLHQMMETARRTRTHRPIGGATAAQDDEDGR
jgi:hypothetical protein